jgi:hypothetical protein
MKNLKISDLSPLFETLDKIKCENQTRENEVKEKLFEAYNEIEEIKTLESQAENLENGEYTFTEHGDFAYQIEIDEDILKLPFISDYFEGQGPGHVNLKEKNITIFCGGPITVNWNHCKRSYFVYDQETGKPVIESFENDCYENETLALLMIEKYQRSTGCFGDVIEICDRYGSYIKHVDSKFGNLSDDELKAEIKKIENELFGEEN